MHVTRLLVSEQVLANLGGGIRDDNPMDVLDYGRERELSRRNQRHDRFIRREQYRYRLHDLVLGQQVLPGRPVDN